jgi:hypothetical protein
MDVPSSRVVGSPIVKPLTIDFFMTELQNCVKSIVHTPSSQYTSRVQ